MMPATNLVWLADFHLTSLVLLTVGLAVGTLIRQPAKRLAIAWGTAFCVSVLFGLVMIPGWSLWSLAAPNADVPALESPQVAAISSRPTPRTVLEFDRSLASNTRQTEAPLSAAPPQTFDDSLSASRLVPFAYLLGTLIASGWLSIGWWFTQRLVREAVPTDGPAAQVLHDLANDPPQLLLSDRLAGPVAVGLVRPTILLPRRMADRADAVELRTVLAHELAHVNAGDLWLLAALRLLLVVLWCNPLFWLLRRRVRFDQETLADAAAASLSDRVGYAERLIGWARDLPPQHRLAGTVGLWESPSQLSKRISVLLDEGFTVLRRSSLRWRVACVTASVALTAAASLVTLGPAEASEEVADVRDGSPNGRQTDGKHQESIDRLTQRLEQDPGNEGLLMRRASSFAKLGRYAEAIADYEAAGEKEKRNWFNAQSNLAHLLVNAEDESFRDAARAVELYEEVIYRGPYRDNWIWFTALSKARLVAGDQDGAVEAQRQAVDLAPEASYDQQLAKLKELQGGTIDPVNAPREAPSIRLRIVDEQGEPIEGAWVGLRYGPLNEKRMPTRLDTQTRTNDDGWCSLPTGKERRATVWARAKGYNLLTHYDVKAGDEEWDRDTDELRQIDGQSLTLTKTQTVCFEVEYDNDDGSHSISPRIDRVGPWPSVRPWIPLDWSGIYRGNAFGRGAVRSSVTGVSPDQVLRATIKASDAGLIVLSSSYFLNSNDSEQRFGPWHEQMKQRGFERVDDTYRLSLRKAGKIRGRVVSDDPNAPLSRSFQLRTKPDSVDTIYGVAEVVPDESGLFEVEKLMDGRLLANFRPEADDPWRARISSDLGVRAGTTTEMIVTIERGVLVKGRVPLASFRREDRRGQPIPVTIRWGETAKESNVPTPFYTVTKSTDQEGNYAFYAPPGTVRIDTAVGPYDAQHQPRSIRTRFTLPPGREFTVPTPDPEAIDRGEDSGGWRRQ